jgi:CRAL/TRIO domain
MFVKIVYKAVSGLLHPDTQKKISVLGSGDMGTLLEYIASDELEMKYGGSLPNLTEYWPIKTTKDYAHVPVYQKEMYEFGGEEV